MSGAYMADGRRRSSMTHAGRGHQCGVCPAYVYGNGGVVSHGRAHVRRGEAVELVKHYGLGVGDSRFFLPTGDPRIAEFEAKGYEASGMTKGPPTPTRGQAGRLVRGAQIVRGRRRCDTAWATATASSPRPVNRTRNGVTTPP